MRSEVVERLLVCSGQITEIILEASTVLSSEKDSGTLNLKNFTRDLKVINGLTQWRVLSKRNIQAISITESLSFFQLKGKLSLSHCIIKDSVIISKKVF